MPLKPREAIRLILEKGGYKLREGGRHTLYMLNGEIIPIPRHGKDISTGVEMKIRKAIDGQ